MIVIRQLIIIAILAASTYATVVGAQERPDPCNTDLSIPLDAYLCSERKLTATKLLLAKEFAATAAALPERSSATSTVFVTKRELMEAQAAWAKHSAKHCALATKFPGQAGDWHFPAANENFCLLAEMESRLSYLRKWRACATEGGGVCFP